MNEFDRVELLASLEAILSPIQYRVIYLRFYLNYTVRETCFELGLTSHRQYYNILKRIDRELLRGILRS